MKRLRRLLKGQRGASLPFALICVAIGTLLISVLLSYVGASYKTSEAARRALLVQYADDAGVEYGLWRLANDGPLRQSLMANLGVPQVIVAPGPVNGITPTLQAVCVLTGTGTYWGPVACAGDECPDCDGVTPSIYVSGGKVVGGPDDGENYIGKLNGTPGPDIMMGTGAADHIVGFGGDDLICGMDGNDHLEGGDGDDVLCGGDGNDNLDGGPGSDVLFGGSGPDTMDGGAGDDFMCGGSGNDDADGEDGVDHLDGGSGNDQVNGGDGFDECCNGNEQGCNAACGLLQAANVFDVQAVSEGITTTVRAMDSISDSMNVMAWR